MRSGGMKRRRWAAVATMIVLLAAAAARPVPATAAERSGPALTAAPARLASALMCPDRSAGGREPALLIHGFTGTSESYWSWTYAPSLRRSRSVCTLDLPDRARADIQLSAQYVVHALRTMSDGRKVDVIAFAGGTQAPRWALRWWPDTRYIVDDLILLAGINHGFTTAAAACTSSCVPALWQLRPDSNFFAALNTGDETPGDVSYTTVYSRTDQFIWSGPGGKSDPWEATSRLDGGTAIAVQDVCPTRPVEHVQVLYDAAVHAVVADALDHPGPAAAERMDRTACLETTMPGVDPVEAARRTADIYTQLVVLMNEHHTNREPPLAPYASS